jgi:pimeloyl-ACP methyl ester carboxylesterase
MPTPAAKVARKPDESGMESVDPRVRRAFGVLEVLSPGLGARWATDLWCTPPNPEPGLRHVPGLKAGEPIEAHWSGNRVVGEAWGEGPPVYLVHGWGGWRGHMGMYVKPLVNAGHRVIAFDLPSHNESGGGWMRPGRTTIDECAYAVEAVVKTHGPAHAIIAHSLGASATLLAATRDLAVERLVMVAPMGDFEIYLDLFARRHNFGPRIRIRLQRSLERLLGYSVLEANPSYTATQIVDPPPLLVIHDPEDSATPYEGSEKIVSRWPGATLMTTNGLGRLAHYRVLRHRPAINAGVDFAVHTPANRLQVDAG